MYEHVNKIAEGISADHPNKDEYLQLASKFRWPYWDWARADTPSVFPWEAAVDDYNTVFTRGFDVKTLPDSKESVFQKDIFGKGIVEKYNPLHHAPFEPNENFPSNLKWDDLDGIKYVSFPVDNIFEIIYTPRHTSSCAYLADVVFAVRGYPKGGEAGQKVRQQDCTVPESIRKGTDCGFDECFRPLVLRPLFPSG